MWDEKKFFDDYVNEVHNVKPDEKFVQSLKQMAWQEEHKKTKVHVAKYAAIAASLVMCICVGGVALHMNMSSKPGKTIEYDMTNKAGTFNDNKSHNESINNNQTGGDSENTESVEETEKEDNVIKSGTIGKKNDGTGK